MEIEQKCGEKKQGKEREWKKVPVDIIQSL